jgi:hypothetical protein
VRIRRIRCRGRVNAGTRASGERLSLEGEPRSFPAPSAPRHAAEGARLAKAPPTKKEIALVGGERGGRNEATRVDRSSREAQTWRSCERPWLDDSLLCEELCFPESGYRVRPARKATAHRVHTPPICLLSASYLPRSPAPRTHAHTAGKYFRLGYRESVHSKSLANYRLAARACTLLFLLLSFFFASSSTSFLSPHSESRCRRLESLLMTSLTSARFILVTMEARGPNVAIVQRGCDDCQAWPNRQL